MASAGGTHRTRWLVAQVRSGDLAAATIAGTVRSVFNLAQGRLELFDHAVQGCHMPLVAQSSRLVDEWTHLVGTLVDRLQLEEPGLHPRPNHHLVREI
jgi:hypothetical protein